MRQGDPGRQLPACTACHGQALTGVAPAVPGLLGLPRDYLNSQLGAWRDGSRRAHGPDCMAALTRRLSHDEINSVAQWLASQALPPETRPLPSAAALERPMPLRCGSVAAAPAGSRP